MQKNNIFTGIPEQFAEEMFDSLLQRPDVHIQRIVSKGHITPATESYRQDWDEWVLLLTGGAKLLIEHQALIELKPGDYVFIPAHAEHRVTWTDPEQESIWLAIHLGAL